jgi:catechol 2,3-dioxygenase-like lactoylglutathione lyase family enzyme
MGVRALLVVSLPVSDPERAKAFYTEQLGFELVRDDDSVPGLRWIEVRPPGAEASLTLVTWFESMKPGSLRGMVLGLDDLQQQVDQLATNGVEIEQPLQQQPWGAEAVIRDPDGNQLVLHQA